MVANKATARPQRSESNITQPKLKLYGRSARSRSSSQQHPSKIRLCFTITSTKSTILMWSGPVPWNKLRWRGGLEKKLCAARRPHRLRPGQIEKHTNWTNCMRTTASSVLELTRAEGTKIVGCKMVPLAVITRIRSPQWGWLAPGIKDSEVEKIIAEKHAIVGSRVVDEWEVTMDVAIIGPKTNGELKREKRVRKQNKIQNLSTLLILGYSIREKPSRSCGFLRRFYHVRAAGSSLERNGNLLCQNVWIWRQSTLNCRKSNS